MPFSAAADVAPTPSTTQQSHPVSRPGPITVRTVLIKVKEGSVGRVDKGQGGRTKVDASVQADSGRNG